MVYELSETDRVAMVCSVLCHVLQPCAAAILIEQDQHIEPIPDFCHLCHFSGMNMENATDFSMYFGVAQYEALNVNHIKGHFHSRFLSQMTLFGNGFFLFQ